MTSREFCYWLQGYFELERLAVTGEDREGLSEEASVCIQKHLAMVFKHEIDPSYPEKQKLAAIHEDQWVIPVKGGVIRC